MPWIESPFFDSELAEADLAASDKQFVQTFADQGYVAFDTGIDTKVFDRIITALAPKYEEGLIKGEAIAQHRLQDAWKYNDDVKAIAADPFILGRLELLYRRRPIPFQTLNFDVGTQQRTHSDMMHFSSIPERFMCGVWVALEDVTLDNGPLHYYPGSHKLPFYNMTDVGIKATRSLEASNRYMDYADHYEEFIAKVAVNKGLKKELALIKKGQALIWAANLLHGGEPITRPGSTRHSQVNHYYFEDCVYYSPIFTDFALQDVFLRKIVDIGTGKEVPNRYLGETVSVKRTGSSRSNAYSRIF
ncbi:phytanoyl-CoA dioxygenase [Flaviaesturariibacter flavus]|uniref:Phytanoyl-CoA dioxygenase n=1 Tax=Flaviaesturariibacter flavus TaxID=2502780 RepID=A0A4V2NWL8_9BACT|nr:phytanoyl-CoA dioxygenase family protein [Flaviaesturariibacter flavus]TCJ17852.1 phytanoyl-CoA dioxygenase [Flaviaesturariibacter flavus]